MNTEVLTVSMNEIIIFKSESDPDFNFPLLSLDELIEFGFPEEFNFDMFYKQACKRVSKKTFRKKFWNLRIAEKLGFSEDEWRATRWYYRGYFRHRVVYSYVASVISQWDQRPELKNTEA